MGADDALTFNLYAYCGNNPVMGYDPYGEWNWGKFFSGTNLLMIGVAAIAAAATVLSCGAAAPLAVAVAYATGTAGIITALNGTAEVIEAGTDYNFVRDGVFNGNEGAYETYKNVSKITAETGTYLLGMYYTSNGGNVCFVAGTSILTAAGHVGIELIEAGDMVWAHDPETGETELKQVVQTFVNEADELVHVFTGKDEIICTNEHPFYSPVKSWTAACKLRAGDILVTVNGEYVVVEKVQHEILESSVKVYNFEVEGFHTYYVGSEDGVLVHNACNNPGGRHGGSTHRNKVNEVKASLEHKGWNVNSQESRIYFDKKGHYRYPDIIATKGSETRFYQIGRVNANGSPVAREVRALRDLAKAKKGKVFFIPYN